MVLGAGLGKRMLPLTARLPKPLVPLAGKPLIDHVLDDLAEAGVETAVVNVHYLADMLVAHLDGRRRPRIVISDERAELLDTGGGVFEALPKLGPDPFFIHNSDSVTAAGGGSRLVRLASLWDDTRMDGLMLLARSTGTLGYGGRGDFHLGDDGRLERPKPGAAAPYVFTGVSIAHPRLLAGCRRGPFSLNQPWDRAIAAGRLNGVSLEGTWLHIGSPDALAEAEKVVGLGTR